MPKAAGGTSNLKSNNATRTSTTSGRGSGPSSGNSGAGGGGRPTPTATTRAAGTGGGFFGGINTSTVRTAPQGSRGGLLGSGGPSYSGPKGVGALNNAARMASARQLGFNAPQIRRTPGDAEALGRMMMAESQNIRNPMGGINTAALQGVGDVVRNRMLSERFPDTVGKVLTQPKQFSPMFDGSFRRTPVDHSATSVAESILSGESAPTVGNALNYANLNTVNRVPGYSSPATKQAFNSMQPMATFADAQNPGTFQHTFGTLGRPSDVAFGGMARPAQMASAAPMGAPPSPQVSDTGPSWWERGKDLAKTGYQTFTDANQKINAVPGGGAAVQRLASIAQSVMDFMPGGAGLANNQLRPGAGSSTVNMGGNQAAAPQATPAPAPVNPVQPVPQPPPQIPWQYPQYSQIWAGLPTGVGGYARA